MSDAIGRTERGTIPGSDVPAFTVRESQGLPVLICAPHAGRDYPADLLGRMRAPRQAVLRLEDRHIDLLAEGAAQATGAALVVARAPRALIDLNRATDDMDWTMVIGEAPPGARNSAANRRARNGLGLVPRRLPAIGEIWRDRIRREELDERISGVHHPYHGEVARILQHLRDRWGAALLIDLHSMPPLAPRAGGRRAAEFVVGDRFGASCHRGLVASVFDYLEGFGREVAHNRPYAGGHVLDRHGAPLRGIHALQIEVCRASYLDAALDRPSARAQGMIRLLSGLVRILSEEVAALGRNDGLPLAAE